MIKAKKRIFLCRRLVTAAAAAAAFLAAAAVCFAGIPDPAASFYVADYADVLSESTENSILSQSEQLDADCGAQIVVVTVNFTDGMDMEDYAYQLFDDWEIGSSDDDNGLLILLSIGDDNYWVTPGSGLSESLSSGTIKNILDEYMEPDFAEKDYDDAVLKTYEQLFDKVSDIYSGASSGGYENYNDYGQSPAYGGFFAGSAIIGIIVLLVMLLAMFLIIRAVIRFFSGIPGRGVPPGGVRPRRPLFFFFGGGPRRPRPPHHPGGPGPGPGMFDGRSGMRRPGPAPRRGGGFGGAARGGGAGRSSFNSHSGRSGGGFSGGRHSGGGGSTRGGGAGRG